MLINMNNFFKFIALCEGISLLILFFIAMPLKYMFDKPKFVRYVGMAHGLLFIGYIILAIMLKFEHNWEWEKFGIVCGASVIPFGTFYIEKKYL